MRVEVSISLNKEGCEALAVDTSTDVKIFTGQIVDIEYIFSKCVIEVGMPVPPYHGSHVYFCCLCHTAACQSFVRYDRQDRASARHMQPHAMGLPAVHLPTTCCIMPEQLTEADVRLRCHKHASGCSAQLYLRAAFKRKHHLSMLHSICQVRCQTQLHLQKTIVAFR